MGHQIITVRSLVGDRVAGYEQHRDHPGGQAMVDGPGQFRVAATPFILGRISAGLMEIVQEAQPQPEPEPEPVEVVVEEVEAKPAPRRRGSRR